MQVGRSGCEDAAEEGYAGAGVAERRKPTGLGNLMIGAPASSEPSSDSSCVMPFSGETDCSHQTASVSSAVGEGRVLPLWEPASARSVGVGELAALVSPALHSLGGLTPVGSTTYVYPVAAGSSSPRHGCSPKQRRSPRSAAPAHGDGPKDAPQPQQLLAC